MGIDVILQAISTVGFPIACCIALFMSNNKQAEQHREEMETVRTSVESLKEAVINNTNVMNNLIDKLK